MDVMHLSPQTFDTNLSVFTLNAGQRPGSSFEDRSLEKSLPEKSLPEKTLLEKPSIEKPFFEKGGCLSDHALVATGVRRARPREGPGAERPLYLCRVEAGFPSPADDYVEASLDLSDYLVRNREATSWWSTARWSPPMGASSWPPSTESSPSSATRSAPAAPT